MTSGYHSTCGTPGARTYVYTAPFGPSTFTPYASQPPGLPCILAPLCARDGSLLTSFGFVSQKRRAGKYLEIDRRAEVLNKRLDIIKELFDMLANELHNSHSNKLEWIVIILIFIEIFFQVVTLIVFKGNDPTYED